MLRGEVEEVRYYRITIDTQEIRLLVRGLERLAEAAGEKVTRQANELAGNLASLIGERAPKEDVRPSGQTTVLPPFREDRASEPVVVASHTRAKPQPRGANAYTEGFFKGYYPKTKVTCARCGATAAAFEARRAKWTSPVCCLDCHHFWTCRDCGEKVANGSLGARRWPEKDLCPTCAEAKGVAVPSVSAQLLATCSECGKASYTEHSKRKFFALPDLCKRCASLAEPTDPLVIEPTGEAAAPTEPEFPDGRGNGRLQPSDVVEKPQAAAVCRVCAYHEMSPSMAILWPEADLCKECKKRAGLPAQATLTGQPGAVTWERNGSGLLIGAPSDDPRDLPGDNFRALADVEQVIGLVGNPTRATVMSVEAPAEKTPNPQSKKRDTSKYGGANNWREKHAAILARQKGQHRIKPA